MLLIVPVDVEYNTILIPKTVSTFDKINHALTSIAGDISLIALHHVPLHNAILT